MNLELLQRHPAKHVPAHSILDYEAFSEGFHDPNDARELNVFEKLKVRVETLGWFDDTLELALQQTLHTIELLVNETRMRMLPPLLHKSALKRDFRARINPKLVYHTLATLSEAGLVDEPAEGT